MGSLAEIFAPLCIELQQDNKKCRIRNLTERVLASFLIFLSQQLLPDNIVNKTKTEVMISLNDVAQVGRFKKVSYKFVREDQENLNRIELKLYDSQLENSVNEEDLAKSSAAQFIRRFSPVDDYNIIDVWLINRGNRSVIHDGIFTFSVKEL